MHKVHKARLIQSAPDKTWETLADFMAIDRFHPNVSSVEALSSQLQGVNACRRCNFDDGNSVVEVVREWRAGAGYRVQLTEVQGMPLSAAYVSLEIEAKSATSCTVRMAMDYRVKWGPIGWLMGASLMKPAISRTIGDILAGLDRHLCTGERVDQKTLSGERQDPVYSRPPAERGAASSR